MSTPRAKTPDLPPEKIRELSPADRDAYFQQKAHEGVDPNAPWFGMFKEWVDQIKGKQQSTQIGDQNVKDITTGGDVKYVQGLQPSSADYLGQDHTALQSFVTSNLDTQQVTGVSQAYFKVHSAFEDFSKKMTEAVNKSKGAWEGDAATNAQSYFTSLSTWSDANSQNARLASETIYDQGQAAQTAKNSMPEPIKFSWGDEFKSWATSNPFNLADNVDKSLQKQKDSQQAHEQAASVMSTYDKNLYEAASKQPVFAPPPAFSTGGGDKNGNGNGNGNGNENGNGNINLPGGNQPGSGNHPSGFSGVGIPGESGSGLHTTGPGPISGPGSTTGSGTFPSTTTPSGLGGSNLPLGGPAATNSNNTMPGMGPMPMGGMPMGGPGFGGDEGYNSKVGRGGGFGPGGGNATGAGSASGPGAGSASGAARPGGIGAAESAAGRGMGGLGSGAGRGGGFGPGGAPRGQHAEGEEDAEHSRPTYLVEGDPDEVFGTDLRTAPPVIGE